MATVWTASRVLYGFGPGVCADASGRRRLGPGTDQKFGFWGGPSSVQLELELPELELSSSEVQFEFEFSSIYSVRVRVRVRAEIFENAILRSDGPFYPRSPSAGSSVVLGSSSSSFRSSSSPVRVSARSEYCRVRVLPSPSSQFSLFGPSSARSSTGVRVRPWPYVPAACLLVSYSR